ncbi:unnamed protein product [Heligmosomoides polygyrus]|uniref:HTH_48 domain-containing protein n=1 Tax=Heligmosomoides polygyrus TaxID=6339 RepID=A0A183G2D4_HELPZ|nr:unnamed protein product [Heligmosomoides polygyrus]
MPGSWCGFPAQANQAFHPSGVGVLVPDLSGNDKALTLRACLLYDFKLKKSAAESHRSFVAAFGEDVVSKRQCERWFQRLAAGDKSLEDEEHGRQAPILGNDLSRSAVEAGPTRLTRKLAVEFVCSKSYSLNPAPNLNPN